jgi:hypothetical protein
MEKADTFFAVGQQWRPALPSMGDVAENASGEPAVFAAITIDNNDNRKLYPTSNHRHSHTAATGVITPGGVNPGDHGDYDALTSALSTSWEAGGERYFHAVPLNSNKYFPLADANPFPDLGDEQSDTVYGGSDSCDDARASTLRSTRSGSMEFELQRMTAKPAPTAAPATPQESGAYCQANVASEAGPGSGGIQPASGTQQQNLSENHQSKKLQKRAVKSRSRKSWLTEKFRRKH